MNSCYIVKKKHVQLVVEYRNTFGFEIIVFRAEIIFPHVKYVHLGHFDFTV